MERECERDYTHCTTKDLYAQWTAYSELDQPM